MMEIEGEHMKKEVLINIRGIYNYDEEEPDVVDLFTIGTFKRGEGFYLIEYEESSATGFEGSQTAVKIEDNNTITMSRTGEANTQLIIEDGVRHQCQYDVGFGHMMLGINGHSVRSTLGHTGGDVSFKYSIDVNSMLASENEMTISVKERVH